MLFYVIGELFQDISVNRSRKSIKSLLEIKPDYANLLVSSGDSESEIKKVSPEDVKIGDTIIVKAGEKIPLDGKVIEGSSFVDTSALTGESVPRKIKEDEEALAGIINQSGLLKIRLDLQGFGCSGYFLSVCACYKYSARLFRRCRQSI
jgi:Cd2+/Zn2+-exporting ATPase